MAYAASCGHVMLLCEISNLLCSMHLNKDYTLVA